MINYCYLTLLCFGFSLQAMDEEYNEFMTLATHEQVGLCIGQFIENLTASVQNFFEKFRRAPLDEALQNEMRQLTQVSKEAFEQRLEEAFDKNPVDIAALMKMRIDLTNLLDTVNFCQLDVQWLEEKNAHIERSYQKSIRQAIDALSKQSDLSVAQPALQELTAILDKSLAVEGILRSDAQWLSRKKMVVDQMLAALS